mgnify:CR=1 FL=1
MSLSSELGTSSGDLNTGDNLSESSFLFLVPQILQIPTNLNLLGSGISQIMQMTQIFFFAVCLSHRFHGIPQIFALCGLGFRR